MIHLLDVKETVHKRHAGHSRFWGTRITYGTWKLGVGHETASNLSVHFSISHMGISAATFKAAEIHGEEKCFRYGNPLFVKCMITMCKY